MKNKILTGLLLVLIGGWGSLSAQSAGSNYARQVNTLIGTKGVGLTSGYLYPGATYPYGMVQFTPSYFSKRSQSHSKITGDVRILYRALLSRIQAFKTLIINIFL